MTSFTKLDRNKLIVKALCSKALIGQVIFSLTGHYFEERYYENILPVWVVDEKP